MDEMVGVVERVTFQNGDNGYTVAKVMRPGKKALTCVVGTMPALQPGETVRCLGKWKNHLVHGWQFEVESYQVETPADVFAMEKYLGSGLIKGIGPVYAKRIVAKFQDETLEMIDQDPDQLSHVAGLGKKRIAKIKSCWSEQKAIRNLMLFLQQYQISPSHAHRIYKTYGDRSIEILQENPYRLAKDIHGVGFKSADKIAQQMGIGRDEPVRIDAGIEFSLSTLSSEGHVCYPQPEFLKYAHELLEVDAGHIEERMPVLERGERIVLEGDRVWLMPLFRSEKGIVRELKRLRRAPCKIRKVIADQAVEWVQKKLNLELAENQKLAVMKSLTDKVHIITGGPGTGKSTITLAILKVVSQLTKKVMCAAPTGRAAKRMSEITGYEAKTIHSLLEFDFQKGGFKRDGDNPLDCDLIIIDEASMIDTVLMNQLLKAIPDGARVLLIGDVNQLPSVGPGNVLKDIIRSRTVTVTELNEIFRQAKGSRIIINAHLINQGKLPSISNDAQSDFFFIQEEQPEKILALLTDLAAERLPKRYGYDPFSEIQILAPMKRGVIGIDNLNTVLQEKLNPSRHPLFRMGRWHKGDKVMQTRNNYDKEVFNGDIGIISSIDEAEQQMVIRYDGNDVIYDFSELDEIALAYAVSIHKYQGSECRCVVIPVHTTHYIMLRRNLLYTGVTRGKELVILVGTKKALALSVKNDDVRVRCTGLEEMLSP